MFKKKVVLSGLLCWAMLFSSGCSVFMAAKQPPKRNLDVLNQGTVRGEVLAELGAPLVTEQKDGKKVDIFKFRQGYTKGVKVSRALFHGVADVFSLGLWEVVGTPTEMIADGKEMKIEVMYDKDDHVEQVNILEGKPKTGDSKTATPKEDGQKK